MIRLGLVVSAVLLLAGCASPVHGPGESGMSEAEMAAKDDGVCRGLGTQPGTQIYVDCRLRLQSNRSMADSLRRYGS